MYYKLTIDETSRNTLKDEDAQRFNKDVQTFKTLEEVKQAIIDKYGKIPERKISNTIYNDSKPGEPIIVGFLHSFWNKDYSHNSKSWYQTDWVTVTEVTENPVLVN